MLVVACKHNKPSQGQEDFTPDDPLNEAIMGLWYNASVPKPNINVVFVQMTLILFTDRSQHPYGIPRPLLDPVVDVIRRVNIHGEPQWLHVPEGAVVAEIHPALLGDAICCQGIAGDGRCLHKQGVHGLAFVIPLQRTNCVNRRYLAQGAR